MREWEERQAWRRIASITFNLAGRLAQLDCGHKRLLSREEVQRWLAPKPRADSRVRCRECEGHREA